MGRAITAALGVVLVLALGAVGLMACGGTRPDPEAQRLQAQAGLELAKARADAERSQAETLAMSERAATRQMERDAAHQRALELLPFVAMILGAVGLAGLGALMFWDSRRNRAAVDPTLALLLGQMTRDQIQLWRAVAHLDRRAALPAGDDRREVVIIDDQRQ